MTEKPQSIGTLVSAATLGVDRAVPFLASTWQQKSPGRCRGFDVD